MWWSGGAQYSPACGCQPLLQVHPQSQAPPVVQAQSARQPQPQGQRATGAGGCGVGREQVQVMAAPDWVDEADGDEPAHGPSIHSPVQWRVNRRKDGLPPWVSLFPQPYPPISHLGPISAPRRPPPGSPLGPSPWQNSGAISQHRRIDSWWTDDSMPSDRLLCPRPGVVAPSTHLSGWRQ